jgi:hypothetical protein
MKYAEASHVLATWPPHLSSTDEQLACKLERTQEEHAREILWPAAFDADMAADGVRLSFCGDQHNRTPARALRHSAKLFGHPPDWRCEYGFERAHRTFLGHSGFRIHLRLSQVLRKSAATNAASCSSSWIVFVPSHRARFKNTTHDLLDNWHVLVVR